MKPWIILMGILNGQNTSNTWFWVITLSVTAGLCLNYVLIFKNSILVGIDSDN